ncbi:hypothetical protein FB45DRAFT_1031835 [Roridomyces roridus]|uniref:Protein-S-isoprenylcysteine O-methyltransferase n=1 Tax=Roridomyces roridus TaxID=1738132 RepID=A0AAD7BIW2_9AGAR|nr:hypothetical protein FB45DRAFT_1031835 [Roridomyces roridus]
MVFISLSSLCKITFILIDMQCMHIIATPPNPPPDPKDCVIFVPDWRERFLRSLAWPSVVLRSISYTANVLEILFILAAEYPASNPSVLLLHWHFFTTITCISPASLRTRILSTLLTLPATLLRLWCYRTLGSQFTFSLSLQHAHKLVRHGPYAFVRHPSYSAMILSVGGAWLALSGSYAPTQCGVNVWTSVMGVWALIAGAVVVSLVLRLPREDEILAARFGREWAVWREEVPWSLVPGVF